MSVWDVLQGLQRLHNAHGQLSEITGNLRIFQNARNFRPRSSDDWDLLNNRDESLRRILRAMRRVKRMTRGLGRAASSSPNHSARLSSLFGTWATAYADSGPDSRPATQAQQAFVIEMLQWNEELGDGERDSQQAIKRMEKMRNFYQAQHDLFDTLKTIAEQFVRHWPNSAQQAQALAWMLDFQSISSCARGIARDYEAGISTARRWRRNLAGGRRECTSWMRWMNNASSRDRNLQTGRAPN